MSAGVTLTWWGHACVTVEIGGVRILTDPVLTGRVAHLSRVRGALPGDAAGRADAVIVSHLHHDHLHTRSLQMLAPGVRIIAPDGAADALARSAPAVSARIEPVRAGSTVEIGPLQIRAVPAAHDGRRSPWSRHHGPALGFILRDTHGGPTVWFAGDTGLFPGMARLGPVDLAVVPIGGWGPTLGPTHLDPAQAAEAIRRVGATDAVPIHYGTLWPTGLRHLHPGSFQRHFADPAGRFVEALEAVCPVVRPHVLHPGRSVTLTGLSG